MSIHHWNADMLAILEKVKKSMGDSGRVLDIGAGDGETRILFCKNWEWNGIDVDPRHKAVNFGDAHKLRFKDDYFNLIISIATFEHLHSPWTASKEINRVLKNGGWFLGTVAFLEPEHGNSYFHMTNHGIKRILKEGEFRSITIKPMANWNVLTSIKIFPRVPGARTYNIIKSKIVFGLRRNLIKLRVYFRKGEAKDRGVKYLEQDQNRYAGSYFFYCTK